MLNGLEIIVGGVNLDLDPSISIPLEIYNPAFNDVGTRTLDFSFPWTENNKIICGFINRITTDFTAELQCVINFNSNILFTGTLKIKSSNDKTGSAYILLENSDYYYLAKQLSLKDVNYGSDVVLGVTSQDIVDYARAIVDLTYPNTNFNFPLIYNPKLYGDDNENNLSYNLVMNGAWDPLNDLFRLNSIQQVVNTDNPYTLCAFLYLHYIVSKIISHFGYQAKGTFLTNTDLKRLLVYNNYPLDWNEKKYYARAETETSRNIIWDIGQINYRTFLY
jgi:hypothetical protein